MTFADYLLNADNEHDYESGYQTGTRYDFSSRDGRKVEVTVYRVRVPQLPQFDMFQVVVDGKVELQCRDSEENRRMAAEYLEELHVLPEVLGHAVAWNSPEWK
jgi:hypothetical protein